MIVIYFSESKFNPGFTLISTLLVGSLLVLVLLGLISLSTIEIRNSEQFHHESVAENNARLALILAIAELQKHAGSDQRVTARAAILEEDGSGSKVKHKNWLGVWSTVYESKNGSYPVIGKVPYGSEDSTPYQRGGVCEDLRHTNEKLNNKAWRDELLLTWLVSKAGGALSPLVVLDEKSPSVVEMLGIGTMGKAATQSEYMKNRVLVEKVAVGDLGKYGWWISDNNQKAYIVPQVSMNENADQEVLPYANPVHVPHNGSYPYKTWLADYVDQGDKMLTLQTTSITTREDEGEAPSLGTYYHDFTMYADGLFTDTALGGLRHDLTPVLNAYSGNDTVRFSNEDTGESFSSDYPIIPGKDHAVLGSSFGSLRDWSQFRYRDDEELNFPKLALRDRPSDHWPHMISDGACVDAATWASSAAKIYPVMTESRWHYYFSHHEGSIRTHLIPRVCLWNPYNKDLEVSEQCVLMPNPFYNQDYGMHFFPDDDYVSLIKERYEDDPNHIFTKWNKRGGYVGGDVYKIRTNPFPQKRYLAFVLEATSIAAGECHVFSPLVTAPSVESAGVGIVKYNIADISANILSSKASQGAAHFYYDPEGRYQISTYVRLVESEGGGLEEQGDSWRVLGDELLAEIDFSNIKDYQPEYSVSDNDPLVEHDVDNFTFILKAGAPETIEEACSSMEYPTLQLINNGSGGIRAAKSFAMQGLFWGSANQLDSSFGYIQSFTENPYKDTPDTHQIGAKLLWLDESHTEGAGSPYRKGSGSQTRWGNDHMAYNVSPIANWNIRAHLVTRSPASMCGNKFYLNSTGPWIHQYLPMSPQDFNDMPSLNDTGTAFVKNPLGSALSFSGNANVVLFDFPSEQYGVLSMGRLRHAMLSPYSWTPSYIIGSSLRDLHAPSDSSAHTVAVAPYKGGEVNTRWDYLLGESQGGLSHGSYANLTDSQGLLQIGDHAVEREVNGDRYSSEEEVLAYDIAYEVNHFLWDRYFLSGMKLNTKTDSFEWNPMEGKRSWSSKYVFNENNERTLSRVIETVEEGDYLQSSFWRNAQFLKNKSAFNVNSTSVNAWAALISGSYTHDCQLKSGDSSSNHVYFRRHGKPEALGVTSDAYPDDAGAWIGGRRLDADEVMRLAEAIVREVKLRGPFISIADFINRRLAAPEDTSSRMGTLEMAIKKAELNKRFFENKAYQSTAINRAQDTAASENNLQEFQDSNTFMVNGTAQTAQPDTQSWGLPGYLTQGDVLESIAPSLTARGDSFTVRVYGESSDESGIQAKVWMEAVVVRSAAYVDSAANEPTDSAMSVSYASGEYERKELSEQNEMLGRRFIVKSIRRLHPDEI